MQKTAIVIDVYRFCTTVYDALKLGAKKVYVTNDRFLPRRMKEYSKWQDLITFGESKGIKLSWTDYDNCPRDIAKANVEGKRIMIRSSMGARRVEKAMKEYDVVFLACMRNYKVYKGIQATFFADDDHDTYCRELIRSGTYPNRLVENQLMDIARDRETAKVCYNKEENPFFVKIVREEGTNLLEAIIV